MGFATGASRTPTATKPIRRRFAGEWSRSTASWRGAVEVLNEKYREEPGRQVVFLVPAGEAVCVLRELVVAGKAPGVARQSGLFRDDRGHPHAHVAALVGYCHYTVIYRRSPVGLPVPDALKKAGLGRDTEALNRVLQEVAWEVVTREPLSGVPAQAPTR